MALTETKRMNTKEYEKVLSLKDSTFLHFLQKVDLYCMVKTT